MRLRVGIAAAGLWAAAAFAAPPPETPPLTISASFLAYSYDHNQILGDKAVFKWGGWDIEAAGLKIDIGGRAFLAHGAVRLTAPDRTVEADELYFDAAGKEGLLVRYGEALDIQPVAGTPGAPPPPAKAGLSAEEDLRARRAVLDGVTWDKLRTSLLCATVRAVEITPAMDVYGLDVIVVVEGVPSIGFKRFKLSKSALPSAGGLALDKVWFSRNQGVFADLSYQVREESKVQSLTRLHYEEHTLLGGAESGLPRQLDLQSATTWTLGRRTQFGVNGDYSTARVWNARLSLQTRSLDGKASLLLDTAYLKPQGYSGEAWLGLETRLQSDAWGALAFSSRYGIHDQALINLDYSKSFGRRLKLQLHSNYSLIRSGVSGGASKIFTGTANLAYTADRFLLSADYHLNNDLLGRRRLNRPQLRFGLTPVVFYGGLLTAGLTNVFIVNDLDTRAGRTESYSNNTVFSLDAAPVAAGLGIVVQAGLSVEQFTEKEGRNFTSGGWVLRASRDFGSGVSLEMYYGIQSRRRTRGWLIEGTTSQDMSALLRVRPGARLSGWMSVSYDPKRGEWKQGFADLSLGLFKNWKFQTLLNYDFYNGRLANIDLYLVRRAGRFDFRLIWRSLSKQFLIELVPAM